MKPKGSGVPTAELKQKLEAAFGSIEVCKKELSNSARQRAGNHQ